MPNIFHWFYLHLIANWKYQNLCIYSLIGLLLLWSKTMTKAPWGGKFIQPMFLHHCSSSKKSRQELKHGRILEAVANAEWGHGVCCLLVYSLGLAQPVVLLKPGTPGQDCHHSQWDDELSLSNHKLRKHPVACSLILWWCFLNWGSCSSGESSLCLDDKKQTSRKLPSTLSKYNGRIRKHCFRCDNESLKTLKHFSYFNGCLLHSSFFL